MNTFDDREKAFEKKFQIDEELQFKIAARSNKYLGEWASSILGKNENDLVTASTPSGEKNFKITEVKYI